MRRLRGRVDGEWQIAAAGAVLAIVGWIVHGRYVAVAGVLIVATAVLVWVWGRESLTAVEYARTLSTRRATFGETVVVDVELVNDKVLPLTWLHVREQVPASLPIHGTEVVAAGRRSELQLVVSMLPYQRMRQRLTVECDHRGEHVFGPAEISSGSPFGTREQRREVRNDTTLLVFPKVVPLAAPLVAARAPVPELRTRTSLAFDPTRVAGVRAYQPGDPVRHVDWRATARQGALLVRVHEPGTRLGVAVFVDILPPARATVSVAPDITELIVSVAASVVSHLAGAGVPTGIFVNGTSRGRLVVVPSSGGGALAAMLEALARVTTVGVVPVERVLLEQAPRLGAGTSALVISADFSGGVGPAVAELRRRCALSALWIATDKGHGPPPGTVDAHWQVPYDVGWRGRDVLELAE